MMPLVIRETLETDKHSDLRAKIDIKEYKSIRARWFLKCRDGTLEEISEKKCAKLDKKFKLFKGGKKYNQVLPKPIKMRGIEYKTVEYFKSEECKGFEVGGLSPDHKKVKDSKKLGPNSGYSLIRLPIKCIQGKSEEVQKALKIIKEYINKFAQDDHQDNRHFYQSEQYYDLLNTMEQNQGNSAYKMLLTQLKLQCGVILQKVKKDEVKGITLVGIYIKKALQLIHFHPIFTFDRRRMLSIYPQNWQKEQLENVTIMNVSNKFPVKKGIFPVDRDSQEFACVQEYFYRSMNKEVFKVTGIKRFQVPLKYKMYYFNLLYVKAKMSKYRSEDEKQVQNDQGNYYPFNKPGDAENEWNFEPENEGEKWLFHVLRYQDYRSIIEKEEGFLPIHTIDADVENPVCTKEWRNRAINEEDVAYVKSKKDEENTDDHDRMRILGDHASYFTINNEPTVLYSHNNKNTIKDSATREIRYQILSRVITGVEDDYAKSIIPALKTGADAEKALDSLHSLQKPSYPLGKVPQDSNCFKSENIIKVVWELDNVENKNYDKKEENEDLFHGRQDQLLPRHEEYSNAKCHNCHSDKCICLTSSEMYTVYSSNR